MNRALEKPATATSAATATGRFSWVAWSCVLFLLYNAGGPHADVHANNEVFRTLTFTPTTANIVRILRAPFTDDGDILRYFAYANAALGRRYQKFYIRSSAEWLAEFQASPKEIDTDAAGFVDPLAPLVPYQDYVVEYPPGLFLIAVPLALLTHDQDVFRVLFGSAMALLLTLALVLCLRIARLLPMRRDETLVRWSAMAVIALGAVCTHRFDAVVSFLLCLTLWAMFTNKPKVAGAALGVAIAAKLVPVIVAPVLVIALVQERRWRDLGLAVYAAFFALAAVLLPAALFAGSHFFDFLGYHANRPLQIESTPAALLSLWRVIDPSSLSVSRSYGSTNVVGGYSDFFLKLAAPLTVLGLLAVYAITWLRLARARTSADRNAIVTAGALGALVAFMVCGKVFSPQYVVWLVPLGVLLSNAQGREGRWFFLMLMLMTQTIYPAAYMDAERLVPWVSALIVLRNGMLAMWAVRLLWKSPTMEPATAHA